MTKKSILRLLQASLMCCLAVLFTACDDVFGNEDNPMSAYLSMSDKPVTLKVGDTYRRKAISVSSAVVEYTSSKTDVATVDNEGLVIAKAEGTTTITATATGYSSQNGKKIYQPASVSYVVTVKPATLPAATINTAPTATAIIAAGSATDLVTAGMADGGTMMYQVTATNTKPTSTDGFSAAIPTAATLAAATYYVWYYAKGDATHSDSEIAATAIAVTVTEVYAANEYNEGSWDSTNKKVVFSKQAATSVTAVTGATANVTWSAGWYTVSGTVTITGNVTLSANTHLILQDGATLTIKGHISGSNKNLYIYGQANQTGQLVVNCTDNDAIYNITTLEVHSCQVTATSSNEDCGGFFGIDKFYVYGGSVDAEYTGSCAGYGIGQDNNGSMNIYGGDVKAVGKGDNDGYSYGIISPSSTVTVYGGKLWAECAGNKALYNYVTLAKDAGFTGKIETSDNGSSWNEYTTLPGTPTTKYVRVGY